MKTKLYLRIIAVAAMLCAHSLTGFGQKGFFQALGTAKVAPFNTKHIEKYALYQIRESDLRMYLLNAPLEFIGKSAPVTLEIPLPDGKIESFRIVETQLLSPQIAAKNPQVKTYSGNGITHPDYSLRITLTSEGFNGLILGVGGDAVYFDKTESGPNSNLYMTYFAKDAKSPAGLRKTTQNRCGTLELDQGASPVKSNSNNREQAADKSVGATLRIFKLAMAADAEFTSHKGGTPASGFAALMGYVSRLDAVYRKELSVSFSLVTGIEQVFILPGIPFTNDDQDAMLDQNQTLQDVAALLNGGYDIGHVLGYTGTSGGGVASRPSVCVAGSKAQGVSGVGDGTYAPVFDDQLVQHEIGHQFSMTHSYNSNIPVCTTRALVTSVEPGSGTTIMSYGYTCSDGGAVNDDDYEQPAYQPFLNFHTVNYEQAIDYINTLSCFTTSPTLNDVPVITEVPLATTIPKSTPFMLVGKATDADALKYSWEGTNISDQPDKALLTSATISDPSKPPFFRSYEPVESPIRYYPRLSAILNGSNYAKGDKLPSVGIVTKHRLTVRDNKFGVAFQDVDVTIASNSGPFLVTNDLSGSYHGSSSQTVTWSVNNTTAAPVSCAFVDIFLSTDGGLTFSDIPLLATTANDGSQSITLPNVLTSTARIKVASSSSTPSSRTLETSKVVFFDISNENFAIIDPLPVTLVSFDAKLKAKNTAALTWETATETDNAGFDIEMSPDAKQFVKVGFVDGNGTATVSHQYQYAVTDLAAGTYYFRLKQLDMDGKFNYSQIRALDVISADDLLSIYPNPTNGKLKFNSGMHKNETFGIKILNQNGQEVMSMPANAKYAQGSELDVTGLPTGLYNITIQGKSFTEHFKFVKM